MSEKKRLLVVSAHAADFVWRAGGTIQTYGLRAEFRGILSTRFKSGVNRAEFFKRITPYCGLTF